MNAVKVKKVLYAFVHIIGPLSYLTISTIWGAFFTTKSTFENISDSLHLLRVHEFTMIFLFRSIRQRCR